MNDDAIKKAAENHATFIRHPLNAAGETREEKHFDPKMEKSFLAGAAYMNMENERLKRIITRELVEDDGLGMEFVYVAVLKDENSRMKEALAHLTYHTHKCGNSGCKIGLDLIMSKEK